MKTSNKILLGFFIVIFLVPVFILMSFKSMIKNGKFTVEKSEPYVSNYQHSGSFKSYKVIKVEAPDGARMKCNFNLADSQYYNYRSDGNRDSIRIYNQADTLFVQYISVVAKKNNNEFYGSSELYADIGLPSLEHLIIENAEAAIKVSDKAMNSQMNIEVYGSGSFNMGAKDESTDKAGDNNISYRVGQLSFKSINGNIHLGKMVDIGQLNLTIHGNTTISIEEGATIEEMKGTLSDSSSVKASWKYVKKLLPLTK